MNPHPSLLRRLTERAPESPLPLGEGQGWYDGSMLVTNHKVKK